MAFIQLAPCQLKKTSNNVQICNRQLSKKRIQSTPRWKANAPNPSPFQTDDDQPKTSDEIPVEQVEGYLENAKVRPRIDIDANEYMLMWKLRKMLHEDDFKRIFDQKSRTIGEL